MKTIVLIPKYKICFSCISLSVSRDFGDSWRDLFFFEAIRWDMAAKSSWICSISPNLWQKFHGHCCKTHHLTVDGTTLVSWLPKGFFAWALTKNLLQLIILVDSWLQIFVTCNYYVHVSWGFWSRSILWVLNQPNKFQRPTVWNV